MAFDFAAEGNVRAGFFVLGLRAWEEDRMAADRSTAELERFLAERADHLLRTAVLLTGSKETGEDLLQTAVERLLRRWRRFDGDPEDTCAGRCWARPRPGTSLRPAPCRGR